MQCQQPNLRLIRVHLLRSDLVEVWVKTEGKEEEKKGRKRERKRKIERDRDRKDIGMGKRQWRSMEV